MKNVKISADILFLFKDNSRLELATVKENVPLSQILSNITNFATKELNITITNKFHITKKRKFLFIVVIAE